MTGAILGADAEVEQLFKMQNTGYLVSQQVLGINLAKNLLMSGKANKFVRVPISEISFQFVAVFEIFSIFRKRRKRLKPVGTVNTLYDESGCTNTDPNLFFFLERNTTQTDHFYYF